MIFGILALLLILFSAFSAYLTPYDPYLQDLSQAKAPPSAEHLLGTDRYGRDMLSRVIVGSRTSIFSTLLLVAAVTVLGTAGAASPSCCATVLSVESTLTCSATTELRVSSTSSTS